MTITDAKQALPEDDYLLALQQRRAEELAASGAVSELVLEGADEDLPPLENEAELAAAAAASRGKQRGQAPAGGWDPAAAEAGKRARKVKKEKAKAAKAELEALKKGAQRKAAGGGGGEGAAGGGEAA